MFFCGSLSLVSSAAGEGGTGILGNLRVGKMSLVLTIIVSDWYKCPAHLLICLPRRLALSLLGPPGAFADGSIPACVCPGVWRVTAFSSACCGHRPHFCSCTAFVAFTSRSQLWERASRCSHSLALGHSFLCFTFLPSSESGGVSQTSWSSDVPAQSETEMPPSFPIFPLFCRGLVK